MLARVLSQTILLALLIAHAGNLISSQHKAAEDQDCFCKLSGFINDCPCNVESVDLLNNRDVYPLLRSLVQSDYFRYFKVNLMRECPFWPDDSKCSLRDCHVNTCTVDQLPSGLKGEAREQEKAKHEYEKYVNDCGDGNLGDLDKTISAEKSKAFANWTKFDDAQDFCELDDESSHEWEYVDLMLNPERYTGYKGESAWRIWSSIYNENCFKYFPPRRPDPPTGPYGPPQTQDEDTKSTRGLCLEKRVFYRVISGLHASINIHLVHQFLIKETPFGPNHWGPVPQMFLERFGEKATKGEGPHRLKNLYFLYLVMMRAMVKAAPYLEQQVFFTGDLDKDRSVRQGVKQLLSKLKSFPNQFDETRLFRGIPEQANQLKEEFRLHFRNISRIMDCVGCDKCKLWGKVQTQGIGTALKILFSGKSMDPNSQIKPGLQNGFQLRRTEISALFNAFARFSSSIHSIDEFRRLLS